MKTTVGSRLLKAAFDNGGAWTQASLARELDVKRQAVGQWVSGDAQPKPTLMAKLEDLLGIPMRAWTQIRAAAKRTGTDG